MPTKISWSNETWNCITGCTRVSEGCINCYAEKISWRLQNNPKTKEAYYNTVKMTSSGKVLWTGNINLLPNKLTLPLSWKKPRMIFTNSMSDLFHDGVPDDYLDALFGIMWITPQHIYQNLTKRPKRMKEYITNRMVDKTRWFMMIKDAWYKYNILTNKLNDKLIMKLTVGNELPQHIGLGISCEDQATADERIPILTSTPAQFRFLSCEPLLENIDLSRQHLDKIHWVICGNESGPNTRIGHLDWLLYIVRQCKQYEFHNCIPVFVKQLGSNPVASFEGKDISLTYIKDKKGADINEFPAFLKFQEFPKFISTQINR